MNLETAIVLAWLIPVVVIIFAWWSIDSSFRFNCDETGQLMVILWPLALVLVVIIGGACLVGRGISRFKWCPSLPKAGWAAELFNGQSNDYDA